jgi:hypothetical protein
LFKLESVRNPKNFEKIRKQFKKIAQTKPVKKCSENPEKTLETGKTRHFRPSWTAAQVVLPAGATHSSAPAGAK